MCRLKIRKLTLGLPEHSKQLDLEHVVHGNKNDRRECGFGYELESRGEQATGE